MNICLIKPPRLENYGHLGMSPAPSLGLAYIAAALEAAGHKVSVIDCIGEAPSQYRYFKPGGHSLAGHENLATRGLNEEEVAERIPKNTQILGFSCMFTNNWLAARNLINYLRPYFPTALFMGGGEHASAVAEYCLRQSELDVIVMGEGEETVVELVSHYEKGEALEQVTGICLKKGNHGFYKTPRRERATELEQIVRPAWHLFPVENYAKYNLVWSAAGEPSLPMTATRGCPYSCTFCSNPDMWGTRYYMRSPRHVADEMEYLKNTFGILNFDFYDLTAIIKKEWIIDFCKELTRRNLNVSWQIPAGTRSEAIDREVAYWLALSGCKNIAYAPESGSPRMLKLIKKKVNLNNMLRSINDSYKENLNVMLNMIIGFPDEQHTDVWKTIGFLAKCGWAGANTIALSIYQPYAGSALFKRLTDENRIQPEENDYYLKQTYIDTFFKMEWYNTNINRKVYFIYWLLCYSVFYTVSFAKCPFRIFRVLGNIANSNYESRFEKQVGGMIRNISKNLRPIPDAAASKRS